MKRLFTSLAVMAAITGSLAAKTLSPDEALARLTDKNSPSVSRLMAKSVNTARLVQTADFEGTTAYYVFADGQQTMFVAADDCATPLLGYVDNPDFDVANMPPAMRWWLDEYGRQIKWASTQPAVNRMLADNQVTRRRAASHAAIAPMCTTQWDQSAPYSNLCPLMNGTRTATGCVATAMAQIIKYFKYPAKGVGSNSYQWNNSTLSLDFTSLNFDYANMLNTYSGNSGTTAQNDAVATLMKAAGYSVNMNYGIPANGGSGASPASISGGLRDHFGYDKAVEGEYRDYYDADTWDNMIYDNLRNVGPIAYGGMSSKGGHCFVCDGYDGNGNYHINWGWSGTSDGYFKLDALNPPNLGTGASATGFNSGQCAILGIRKPVAGSQAPEAYLGIDGELGVNVNGWTLIFSAGNGSANGFFNKSSVTGDFSVALQLKNVSTGSTQIVATEAVGEIGPGYGTQQMSYNVPQSVAAGDYQATPVYKVGNGAWKPFRCYYGARDYVEISIASGGITVTSGQAGQIQVTSCTVNPTTLTAGGTCTANLVVTSTYDTDQTMTLGFFLCQPNESNQLVAKAMINSTQVTIPAKGTARCSITGKLVEGFPNGTYYVVIVNEQNIILNEPETIEVGGGSTGGETPTPTPDPGTSDANVVATSIVPLTSFCPGSPVSVRVQFKNKSTVAATVKAQMGLCTYDGSVYQPASIWGAQEISIAASSTYEATFSGTLDASITTGTYYLMVVNEAGKSYASPIQVQVEDDDIDQGNNIEANNNATVNLAVTSTGFRQTAACTIDVTFTNQTMMTQKFNLTPEFFSVGDEGYVCEAMLGAPKAVSLNPKSSATVTFSSTLGSYFDPGKYYLMFIDANDKAIGGQAFAVTVRRGQYTPFTVSSFSIPGGSSADAGELTFNVTATPGETAPAEQLAVLIYPATSNNLAATVTIPTSQLVAGQAGSASVTASVPGLTVGQKYVARLRTQYSKGLYGTLANVADVPFTVSKYSGVESIGTDADSAIDTNAPVEYFNLQGQPVSSPVKGQLMIVRQGSHVSKQIIR